MFHITRVLLSLVVVLAVGCATVIDGRTEKVTFTSEPEGATVSINGEAIGKTPLNINLDRESDPTLTFELDGYQTFTTTFDSGINPLIAGNIIIGGLFGTTTDAASGAMHEYKQNSYYVELKAEDATPMSVPDELVSAKAFIISNAIDIRVLSNERVVALELSELFDILGVATDHREDEAAIIDKLSLAFEDDVEFADAVVSHYMEQKS